MTREEFIRQVCLKLATSEGNTQGIVLYAMELADGLIAQEVPFDEPGSILYAGQEVVRMPSVGKQFDANAATPAPDSEPRYVPVEEGGEVKPPQDLAQLRSFASLDWKHLRGGTAKQFRKEGSKPGFCAGSKFGSCGKNYASHDEPRWWVKGMGTICEPCHTALSTEAAVVEDEEIPF